MSYLHRKLFHEENFMLHIYFIIIVIIKNIVGLLYMQNVLQVKRVPFHCILYFITIAKDYLISLLYCMRVWILCLLVKYYICAAPQNITSFLIY